MSGSIRLHVATPLAAGTVVSVTPAQAHYLATVMRRAVGAPVRLFNGADGEWAATIVALGRDHARLLVQHPLRAQTAEPDLWLAFALLRRDATDLAVQKATELGAALLLPLLTARTGAARVNTGRLAAIATEAAEQSERLTVPRIAAPQGLSALLAGWPPARPLFAAIERAAAPPIAPHADPAGLLPAGLLIGPEGGFAPAELDELARHPFVRPVSLGARILRAETAAIVGLALLQAPGGG